MSTTPRGRGHQTPSPSRRKQSSTSLVPIQKPSVADVTHLTKALETLKFSPKSPSLFSLEKRNTHSTFLTNPVANSTFSIKPYSPSSSISPSRKLNNNIRPIRDSLDSATSSVLSLYQGEGLVPINDKETRIVPFGQSDNGFDSGDVSLQEDDPNITVDKLLEQWGEIIKKAEQDFEEEELAFQRAQARSASRNRSDLSGSSLSPTKTTKLLDKAKGFINQKKLSPIRKRNNPL